MGNDHRDTLRRLRRELPGVEEAVPLAPLCAYGVGGPAEFLVEARTDEALVRALSVGSGMGLPICVLGQATNVLIGDGGVPGLLVLARNDAWSVEDDVLTAGAGTVLAGMIVDLAECGLGGLEFAGNIPGSVGGAVVGNAGAYGRCVADALIDVDLATHEGRVTRVPPATLDLGYRTSAIKRALLRGGAAGVAGPDTAAAPDPSSPATESRALRSRQAEAGAAAAGGVVVGARFRLTPGARGTLLEEIARDAELRRSKHPLEYASCGSYFKNPSPQRPAAQLIQEAGLKGLTVGRARVSERHANFLVALEGATAVDLRDLATEVKRLVKGAHGVDLEEEVVHLGSD